MKDHEKKMIDDLIHSYQKMIKYFENQICILQNKKIEKCCFEKTIKHRLKIKGTKCQKSKKTY